MQINITSKRLLTEFVCRSAVAEALRSSASDVKVRCSSGQHAEGHVAFWDMLHAMERSLFVLVLPGDSPCSRRLSEVFLAGAVLAQRLCNHLSV